MSSDMRPTSYRQAQVASVTPMAAATAMALGHRARAAKQLDALILTTAPDAFATPGLRALGEQVAVCDTLELALHLLSERGTRLLFSDLTDIRAASGAWTGLRLLRHLKEPGRHPELRVWLMTADKGYPHVDWVISLGAEGVLRRSASEVLRCTHWVPKPSDPGQGPGAAAELMRLEQAYGRLAPPGVAAGVGIQAARRERDAGRIGGSAQDYALALAGGLNAAELREALCAALLREAQVRVSVLSHPLPLRQQEGTR